jgi:hypothetical protein
MKVIKDPKTKIYLEERLYSVTSTLGTALTGLFLVMPFLVLMSSRVSTGTRLATVICFIVLFSLTLSMSFRDMKQNEIVKFNVQYAAFLAAILTFTNPTVTASMA